MPLDLQTKLNIVETDPDFAISIRGGPDPEDEYLALRVGDDYRSYAKMRRDPHVRSQLRKRIQAILGRRVLIEGGDKKTVEQFEKIVQLIGYEDLCSQVLNTGQLIGFAVLRLDWEEIDGYTLPRYEFVPQNRFSFAYAKPDDTDVPIADGSQDLNPKTEIVLIRGYELRLLTKAHPLTGERCPKGRFLVYTFDAEGSPWGLGLGYSIFPWWTVKRQAMQAWLLHSDRIGSPPIIGNTPDNLNEKNIQQAPLLTKFDNWLRSASPNGWFRGSAGFDAKLLDDPSSSPDVHERLINIADAQISKAVLGEVSFSDKSTGSYAANQSQVDDRESSLTDADCNLLDEQLNQQLWAEIVRLNFPNLKDVPEVRRESIADQRKVAKESEQEKAKKDRVDRDKVLLDMGFRVKAEDVKRVYGDEYVDTSIAKDNGEDQKQALISILQVGGTQALIGFLSGFSQSGLSKENAIAVLTTVFGVSADLAAEMLPESPAPEEVAPTDLQGALDNALSGAKETPATADTTDLAEPLATVEAVLDRVLSAEFSGAIDFATKAKGPKKCKETSVSCGNSCQRAGTKCKNKPNPEGQKAGDLLEKSIGANGQKNAFKQQKAKNKSDAVRGDLFDDLFDDPESLPSTEQIQPVSKENYKAAAKAMFKSGDDDFLSLVPETRRQVIEKAISPTITQKQIDDYRFHFYKGKQIWFKKISEDQARQEITKSIAESLMSNHYAFAGDAHQSSCLEYRKLCVDHTGRKNDQEYFAPSTSDRPRASLNDLKNASKEFESNSFAPSLKAAFEADTKLNQEYARQSMGDKFTLQRGISGDLAQEIRRRYPNAKPGDEIEIDANAVSSWTARSRVAEVYAKNKYGIAGDSNKGITIEADFSPQDVAFHSDIHPRFHEKETYNSREGYEVGIFAKTPVIKVRIARTYD